MPDVETRPVKRGPTSAALLLAALAAAPASAQNVIAQDDWEGFAMRDPGNRFDRCALYNRSVAALTASPYEMLGITRDAAGRIGLLIFYTPGTLTRGATSVDIRLDGRAPVTVPGEVLSDFHAGVSTLDGATVSALRAAKELELRIEGHAIRFALNNIGAVLDRLDACVKTYGPKSSDPAQ